MQIKTKGIVLKHRNIGETDRILTILSEDLGLIEATARRVQTSRSGLSAATQILSSDEFVLYRTKNGYVIDYAQTVTSFYALRYDIEKVALGGYFSELTIRLTPTSENSKEFLSLILNSLYMLEKEKRDIDFIKAVFELKALSISGFMPNLIGCSECNEYVKESMYFFPVNSILICDDCLRNKINSKNEFNDLSENYSENLKIKLYPAVLAAMRHIVYSESKKIFSFKLSSEAEKQLCAIAEYYAGVHTDTQYKSLNLYKSLKSN